MTMTLELTTEATVPDGEQPTLYWGLAEIGKLFGVSGHTVDVWIRRYTHAYVAEQIKRLTGQDPTPEQIAAAVPPRPDIILGLVRPQQGWDPETAPKRWRDWTRPGLAPARAAVGRAWTGRRTEGSRSAPAWVPGLSAVTLHEQDA
jgi:hypothetical protein